MCKQADAQKIKYLCKYFDFKVEEDTLYILQNIYDSYTKINEREKELVHQKEKLLASVKSSMPKLTGKYSQNKATRKLGLLQQTSHSLKYPHYQFSYTSPKGRSTQQVDIFLDYTTFGQLVNYFTTNMDSKNFGKKQRSMMTVALRTEIKERDNHTCVKCGISVAKEPHLLLEVDHIIPISKGGTSTPSNLQTLCWKCNRSKGNKT